MRANNSIYKSIAAASAASAAPIPSYRMVISSKCQDRKKRSLENDTPSNPRKKPVSSATSTASKKSGSTPDKKRSRENDTPCNPRKKTPIQQKQASDSNFRLQITIYFDGGSRGNPGLAGAGADVVVADNSNDTPATTTFSVREYCGLKQTNNFAEYHGLLAGLKQAKMCIEQYSSSKQLAQSATSSLAQNPLFQLQIFGDSNLIIQQLKGAWQCRHPNIKPLFHQCQQLIGEMKGMWEKSEVLYEHVYRKDNKVADGECQTLLLFVIEDRHHLTNRKYFPQRLQMKPWINVEAGPPQLLIVQSTIALMMIRSQQQQKLRIIVQQQQKLRRTIQQQQKLRQTIQHHLDRK